VRETTAGRFLPKRLLHVGLSLAQAGDAVAGFPLAAFFKKFNAFKTLHDIALATQGGCRAETAML
jgi:hypothetical protein